MMPHPAQVPGLSGPARLLHELRSHQSSPAWLGLLVRTMVSVGWAGRTDSWLRTHPRALDILLAWVLTLAVGWKSLDILLAAQGPAWVIRTAGVAAAILHVIVVLWRAAPDVALGVSSLCAGTLAVLPDVTTRASDVGVSSVPTPLDIPLVFLPTTALFLLTLYGVAAHRPARTAGLGLVIALIGAAVCTARTAHAYGALPPGWLTLVGVAAALTAACVGAWASGRLTWERRRRRWADASRALELAATEERVRIARDLHDILAHSLTVVIRQAEGGLAIAASSPERVAPTFENISEAARCALSEMRESLALLRQPAPGVLSVAAVTALVARARAAGAEVHLQTEGARARLTPAAELAAYRTIQEGLTNAVKHAGPEAVLTVVVRYGEHSCVVEVSDSEGGMSDRPDHHARGQGGEGLLGLSRRVQSAGGSFRAGPTADGFHVHASFETDAREAPA